jgi:uncharacterized protein YuzE
MRITYDPEVDAAYIYFQEAVSEVTTVCITADLILDLGPAEKPVGVEVLSASKHLGLSPKVTSVRVEIIGHQNRGADR